MDRIITGKHSIYSFFYSIILGKIKIFIKLLHSKLFILIFIYLALQTKLNEEKSARQKADLNSQEKERQISMLSVDYRQIQQRLQKLEGEYRQEVEKVKALHSQVEQEQQKKTILQSEMGQQSSELNKLKAKESQLVQELSHLQVRIFFLFVTKNIVFLFLGC